MTKCVTTDGRRLTPASFLCFLALPDSNPVPRILNVLNQRLNWIWLSEYKLSTIRYSASEKPFLSAFFRVSYPPHTREVMGSSPIGSIAAESEIFSGESGFLPFLLFIIIEMLGSKVSFAPNYDVRIALLLRNSRAPRPLRTLIIC